MSTRVGDWNMSFHKNHPLLSTTWETTLHILPLKDNIPLNNSQKHHQPCLINQTSACAFLSVFGTTISHDPYTCFFSLAFKYSGAPSTRHYWRRQFPLTFCLIMGYEGKLLYDGHLSHPVLFVIQRILFWTSPENIFPPFFQNFARLWGFTKYYTVDS